MFQAPVPYFSTVQSLTEMLHILERVTAVFDLIEEISPSIHCLECHLISTNQTIVQDNVVNHRSRVPTQIFSLQYHFVFWGGMDDEWRGGAAGLGEDLPQYADILQHLLVNRVHKRNVQHRGRVKEAQLKYMLSVICSNIFVLWIYNKSLLLQIYQYIYNSRF